MPSARIAPSVDEGEDGDARLGVGAEPPLVERHVQSIECEWAFQMSGHHPADNAAAVGVQHHGQVQVAGRRYAEHADHGADR